MSVDGWEEVKLGKAPIDLIDGDRGKNYPSGSDFSRNGHCLFLNAKNVTSTGFVFDERMFITKEKDELLRKGKLVKKDIVMTTRGTVGNVAFFSDSTPYENMRINSGMVILRCDECKIYPRYGYYVFKSPIIQNQISAFSTGSAQPQLPISIMRNLKFFLPLIEEQKAIAATLSCLDDKIELNNRINKNLEEIAQAIFKSWFVDFEPFQDGEFEDSELGKIPKGWRVGTLGDILNLNYGKALPAKKRINGKIRVYSSAGITGYHNESLINEPSIIIGRKGTIGTVYYSTVPSFCIDTAYFATQNDSKFPLLFMYQLLKELDLGQYNEDSAVPGLNRNMVYAINIVIPPDSILNQCNNIFTTIYNLIFDNLNQTHLLNDVRDTLLPKLMSGEIRVPVVEVI